MMNQASEKPSQIKEIKGYQYEKTKSAGKGGFGRVYFGWKKDDPTNKVAIKVLSKPTVEACKTLQREITILQAVRGDHIIEYYDSDFDYEKIYIITSLCNGGTLMDLLEREKTLSEIRALDYLMQIALAFKEIQESLDNGVLQKQDNEDSSAVLKELELVHRDIKPANILLHDGKIKICDFGISRFVEDDTKTAELTYKYGTFGYSSIQIMIGKAYSSKADVWSAGIVFYEMLFGYKPWKETAVYVLVEEIKANPKPTFPPHCDITEESKDLILSMLALEEADRIDWKGILEHPAFYLLNMVKCQERFEDL